MNAIVVHHPVRLAVGRQEINVQATLFGSHVCDRLVVTLEDREIRVAPRLSPNHEIRHVVGTRKHNDGLDTLANAVNKMG